MTKNTWTRELALKTPVRSKGEKTGNLNFTLTKKIWSGKELIIVNILLLRLFLRPVYKTSPWNALKFLFTWLLLLSLLLPWVTFSPLQWLLL